jgi:beclin 1-associated autophagy-related key regulator
MEELRNVRRSKIESLIKYIFPITQRQLNDNQSTASTTSSSSSSNDKTTLPEIAEAMKPISSDKPLDSSSKFEYTISDGPSLVSNENIFYDYCRFLAFSKDGTSANDTQIAQNAYRITASLELITQLITSLSFYLDVRLPHKLSSSDFSKVILNEPQFRRKVAKLNMNIIYFAYMQNVPSRCIKTTYNMMENVLHLLDFRNEFLGKTCAIFEASDNKAIESIMHSFTDLNDENESDFDSEGNEDDDDVSQKEWENIYAPPMMDHNAHSLAPMAAQETSSSNAMTTTIINVAHSFWSRWNK